MFPDEVLLRTVPNSVGYYTPGMGNWAVNPNAFEPSPKDVDGISLFRRDFVTRDQLAKASAYTTGVRVAHLSAREFGTLNLSVKPSPNPQQPPGHVVVPEMSFVKKTAQTKDKKQRIHDLAQELAQIASRNGVYSPAGLIDPVRRPKQ